MKKQGIQSKLISILLFFLIALTMNAYVNSTQETQQKEKQEKEEKPPRIIEEIVVIGEQPRDKPVSTVTMIKNTQIELYKPLDLAEIIRFAPGVSVTFGDKSVYTLKLRGIDSNRISLLVDGIPVYEPYFSAFDLKTISAEGIDTIKLAKGPTSVLYGPNTLGGIVNIITRRPSDSPELSLKASYGERNTSELGLNSSFQLGKMAFSGMILSQNSDGFYYPSPSSSERIKRANSNYSRFNLNTKLYYNPSGTSEILIGTGIHLSDYAMPPQIESPGARYWDFKNWDRYSFNAGGFKAINDNFLLKFRGYFVRHENTLAMYRDEQLTMKRFESTHKNDVYGFFGLGDLSLNEKNRLQFSLNIKEDKARTQGDTGLPWNGYKQGIYSAGIEENYSFLKDAQLVFGLSLDHLNKFTGEDKTVLNPLAGIRYSPSSSLDLHLSLCKKSRFPSMRAMWGDSTGNPDLMSESGVSGELGFSYSGDLYLSGAVFITRIKDLIESVRLPEYDFLHRYFNIKKARIDGFELQLEKVFKYLDLTINYTFLNHWNEYDAQPLTGLPKHSFNFDLRIFPASFIYIGLKGLAASDSFYPETFSTKLLEVPAYFNLDSILAVDWKRFEFFIKATNLFDSYIYTELGFPWRGRYFEIGFKVDVYSRSKAQRSFENQDVT